jgi:dGTPase
LAALERLKGFRGIPWRTADLLHVRKVSQSALPEKRMTKEIVHTFSRRPSEFRIFSRGKARADKSVIIKELPRYSENISTRAHPDEDADVWSTEKAGIQIGEIARIHIALEAWASGASQATTVDCLVHKGLHQDHASDVAGQLENRFSLWSKFAAEPPLRLDPQIEEARVASLSGWATKPSSREHPEPTDPFRGPYQRDRDRVLWSSGLRRLSNKTQLFPVEHDDDLRQRITHSIEVFQLASFDDRY